MPVVWWQCKIIPAPFPFLKLPFPFMATLRETQTSNEVHHQHDHEVVVVIVPLPAQGHLNQLLHLSHLISASFPKIPVHYAASATHIRQAKLRLHGWDSALTTIHFHGLLTPPFPSPPPLDPTVAATTTRFPAHQLPAIEAASSQLRHPIASLLRSLSPTARRLVIIHDCLMASAVRDFSSLPNAESFSFYSVSAYSTVSYRWLIGPKPLPPFLSKPEGDLGLPPIESLLTPEFLRFVESQQEFLNLSSGILYNTCAAMEAPFISLLKKEQPVQVWAIGPFHPIIKPVAGSGMGLGHGGGGGRHKCLEWLDKQREHTVLYVAFGTTTAMARDQIDELAFGLERSGQKFIWVLRNADRGDVFSGVEEEEKALLLAEGFEERVNGRGMGMAVREWAPQLEILGHPATGGFMSHCGWNSCVESMGMGVPIAAWPMHSDQLPNAVLVTKHLKVGVAVREWDQRSETVTRDEVEKTVRRLMASEEGEELRRRAAGLGDSIRKSAAEGGASRVELGSFIAHITR